MVDVADKKVEPRPKVSPRRKVPASKLAGAPTSARKAKPFAETVKDYIKNAQPWFGGHEHGDVLPKHGPSRTDWLLVDFLGFYWWSLCNALASIVNAPGNFMEDFKELLLSWGVNAVDVSALEFAIGTFGEAEYLVLRQLVNGSRALVGALEIGSGSKKVDEFLIRLFKALDGLYLDNRGAIRLGPVFLGGKRIKGARYGAAGYMRDPAAVARLPWGKYELAIQTALGLPDKVGQGVYVFGVEFDVPYVTPYGETCLGDAKYGFEKGFYDLSELKEQEWKPMLQIAADKVDDQMVRQLRAATKAGINVVEWLVPDETVAKSLNLAFRQKGVLAPKTAAAATKAIKEGAAPTFRAVVFDLKTGTISRNLGLFPKD